jgi:hypothetical protein
MAGARFDQFGMDDLDEVLAGQQRRIPPHIVTLRGQIAGQRLGNIALLALVGEEYIELWRGHGFGHGKASNPGYTMVTCRSGASQVH